jgi:ABC-type multidrug transport system ATPase subunit
VISLQAHDLGKRYNKEWIFRRLTFQFKGGQIYAITGPNGSGKSTLLQILWGQSPPSAGTLTYRFKDKTISPEDLYKHVAIATPYMDLIEELTLLEQVRFHQKMRPFRDGLTAEQLIDVMELAHASNKLLTNFSSGMKQRVKLALAFYTDAQILFLDEPGTNLDKKAFDWYLRQMDRVSAGTLTFIASNNPEEYIASHATINIMDYKNPEKRP